MDSQSGLIVTTTTLTNNNAVVCQSKYYLASDNITSTSLKNLVPLDIIDIFVIQRPDLHWCPTRQTGVVFFMLGSLSEFGKIGMTAIANSSLWAHDLFSKAVEYLIAESKKDSI
jgi:aryl-alcohol dehydrogenase-like predicted oxidoreductase